MIRREFLAGLTSLSALAAAPAVSFAQAPMNLGQQWDVIVIGSGLAGLSAALSASENGADRILVIEKLPVLGGHSRLSTGSLCRRRLSLGLRFQNDPRFHRFSLHIQTQSESTRTRRPLFV